MFVKPKKGLIVIDPANGKALPEIGKDVPESQYWLRCIQSGDVTKGEAEKLRTPEPMALKGE